MTSDEWNEWFAHIILLQVAVEVEAGLASAVGEAADLASEADTLHATIAGCVARAALQLHAGRSLLVVITGDPGSKMSGHKVS